MVVSISTNRPSAFGASSMAVDEPAMVASWRALLESGAKVLYPGHGKIVTIDEIVPVFRRALARKARLARRRSATAESPIA